MPNTHAEERVSGGLGRCMLPMLDALGWKGDKRAFLNALPYDYRDFTVHDMMNTMANLGFKVDHASGSLNLLDTRLLPCLFINKKDKSYVLASLEENGYFGFHGESSRFELLSIQGEYGDFFFFKNLILSEANPEKEQKEWFSHFFTRFRRPIFTAIFLSLILTLIALAAPFIVMGIYSQINASESMNGFWLIGTGIVGILLVELLLRFFRHRILAYLGARMSYLVANQVFKRILSFNPSATENAPVGAQIVRMRDFNSVKAFVEGPGITAVMELPFLVILFVGLIVMAGYLAIIPVLAFLFMILFSLAVMPFVRKNNTEAAASGSRKQAYLIELFSEFGNIRMSGLSDKWKERFENVSADATMDALRTANINAVINHVSQGTVSIAGALTISVGVYGVLKGQYSGAVLIAAMMLVWKILAPVSSGFSVFSQTIRIKKSLEQLDRFMSMRLEPSDDNVPPVRFRGHIRFKGISLRYKPDYYPALLGINLEIKGGEFILLCGHDGAGKSTLLKLIMGMYKAQTGTITLDKTNIQQLPPALLRRSIAYLPQEEVLFNTTIEENMKYYSPTSGRNRIQAVLANLNMAAEIDALPDGIRTQVSSLRTGRDMASFRKRLCLARTLLNDSHIVLLDEPDRGLEPEHLQSLTTFLKGLKRQKTILVAGNHPAFKEMADKVVNLNIGTISGITTPSESGS